MPLPPLRPEHDFEWSAHGTARVCIPNRSRSDRPLRATEPFPALPEEVWTYIFGIRAATTIQARFRGFKTRRGPRYLVMFVKKGWLQPARAMFWAAEFEKRDVHRRHVVRAMWGEIAESMA